MKYEKDLFIENLKYLISYNCEPEITLKLSNNDSVFLIAYKEFIELTISNGNNIKIFFVEDIFNHINFESIIEIESCIDFEFPAETQSVVVEDKLWFDTITPKQVIKKFNRKMSIYRFIILLTSMIALSFLVISIFRKDTLGYKLIIPFIIFGLDVIISLLFFTVHDIKRENIIKKYYGQVTEKDKQLAKKLLKKVSIVDKNEYDFFDLFRYSVEDLPVNQVLKLLMKGKKVYIGFYISIKEIEQELLLNNANDKYNDVEFNNYIFELIELLERNLCDL